MASTSYLRAPPTLSEAAANKDEYDRLDALVTASGWDLHVQDAVRAAPFDIAIGEDAYIPVYETIFRSFFRSGRYSVGRLSYGNNEVCSARISSVHRLHLL